MHPFISYFIFYLFQENFGLGTTWAELCTNMFVCYSSLDISPISISNYSMIWKGQVPHLALFNWYQHLGKRKHVSESSKGTFFLSCVHSYRAIKWNLQKCVAKNNGKNSWKIHSLYQSVILPICEAVKIYHLVSIVHQMIITLNYCMCNNKTKLTDRICQNHQKSFKKLPAIPPLIKLY